MSAQTSKQMNTQASKVVMRGANLEKHYPLAGGWGHKKARQISALQGVSFALKKNTTLAVVGESGCGKSTLARLCTMIERPSAGSLEINGIDITSASDGQLRDLRSRVQIVFQDPYNSLNPRQRVGHALEEPLLVNKVVKDSSKRKDRAMEMLEQVGLRPEHFDRYPHMFSGGQRQRIAIARALMLSPEILVLDEPVSALDISIQAQILNLISDLQKKLNLSYLFISHDLTVVKHVSDEVMVMYLGRCVEHGSTKDIFANSVHPYTEALLSATPQAIPGAKRKRKPLTGELPSPLNPPSGCVFHPRCPLCEERCKIEVPKLLPVAKQFSACHVKAESKKSQKPKKIQTS